MACPTFFFSRRTPRRAAQPRCLRLRSSAADTAAAARCRPRDSGRPAVRHPGRGHPGGILETIEKKTWENHRKMVVKTKP